MVTEDCLIHGVARAFGCRPQDVPVLTEHASPAAPRSDLPAVSAYVDNGNIVGPNARTVSLALECLLDELTRRELVFHDVVWASPTFVSGGGRGTKASWRGDRFLK